MLSRISYKHINIGVTMSLLCAAAVATADFLRASGFLDTISGAAKRSDKLSDIPLPG